ncbi:hypothetical protein Bbelb_230090 [Branchiostoma belcheri]|nr:hypothetical protein Bbelb_230090 [Branchiostoma belcheri]
MRLQTIGFSDHDAVIFTRKSKIHMKGPRTVHKRSYKMFKEEDFLSDIHEAPWHLVYNFDDVDDATDMFTDILQDICDKHAPIRKFTVRSNSAPWLTSDIQEVMKLRDEAKRGAKASGFESDWAVFRKLRNKVVSLCRKAKTRFFRETFESCSGNARRTWNTINSLLGRKHTVSPTSIEADGKLLTKPKDIADHFAGFYEDKVNKLRSCIDFTNANGSSSENSHASDSHGSNSHSSNSHVLPGHQQSFTFDPVTGGDVHKILSQLQDCKAPGQDGIENRLLRMSSDTIAGPMAYIINLSFTTKTFPTRWKHAKVVPIPKDNRKPLSGPNSRPVSLLPACGKICESIAAKQIASYLLQSDCQSEAQHAHRKLHSTETALLKMTDDWLDNMDNGFMTAVVLLDYSAAFDLVDHNLLLQKLETYGFTEDALDWTESYLTNRKWQVYTNGAYSSQNTLHCGVPQGSCLGPQLYNIYVNDMPEAVQNGSLDQYADDSTIHTRGHTLEDIRTETKTDLERVATWSDENMLKLNNGKTKTMLVGTAKKTRQAPPLELELRGQRLEQCPSVKLLGLHLDQNLTYDNHIAHIVKKCNRSLAQVGRVKDLLPHRQRIAVVNALIIPHIDYCCSVWGNTTQNNIRRLQVVQNRAARLALGCDRDAHVDTMLKTLGWLTVRDRIQQRSLVTFKRIMLTKQPKALYDKITFQSEIHKYSTRHTVDLEGDRILDTEQDYFKRGIKEAIYIRALQPSLNWDGGRYRLQTTFDPLLTSHLGKITCPQHLGQMAEED